jgi:hypothetical protein
MKKKYIFYAVLTVILVGAPLLLMAYLAEAYPLRAYHGLYPLQHLAEQGRMRLTFDKLDRAHWSIQLAERRLADLAHSESEQQILASASAFSMRSTGRSGLSRRLPSRVPICSGLALRSCCCGPTWS